MFVTCCSESKHCNRVFTLYFLWQLLTNNFYHLFHVQSRKSVKLNLLCLRLFLALVHLTNFLHLPGCVVVVFFWLVKPPALQCDNMNMNNYSLIFVMHVDSSLKKHWRLQNYLVTLFPSVILDWKVYGSVHKLHMGPVWAVHFKRTCCGNL